MTPQTSAVRTPSAHRAALDAWRATAPRNDSHIMPAIRHADRPLARSLAKRCRPLLSFRAEPSGEPLKTNWRSESGGDLANPEDVENLAADSSREITPSRAEIMRQVATDDVEHNAAGQVVRIGKLRFSDGTQTEWGFARAADGSVIRCDFRMPVGAMLGSTERVRTQKGNRDVGTSNVRLAKIFKVAPPRHIPGSRNKRTGKSYSREEAAAMLAQAIANTPTMPPVTKCPTALPAGSSQVGDIFMSLQKRKTGYDGAPSWQDQFSAIAEREAHRHAKAALPPEHVRVMEAALVAETLADVGAVMGHTGDYARHAGKRLLVAANDNLSAALKKFAA